MKHKWELEWGQVGAFEGEVSGVSGESGVSEWSEWSEWSE